MQRFILFLLKRRLLISLAAIGLLATGYYNYRKLPVEAFPDVSPNLVQVFTVTEGLAPEEVEKYVTYPLEVAMNGLPNLKLIRSVSNFGLSMVNIYFEDDADIYLARQLVNERIRLAQEQIPEGFGRPRLGPISTSMGLVLFYYLRDRRPKQGRSLKERLMEMRTLQEWVVGPMLRTVPGVTEVLGIGGWEKQYHVLVRPQDLLRYGLTIEQVIERIRANNANTGAQFIEQNKEEYLVRTVGLATSILDLDGIVVKADRGTPVYRKQVADVRLGGALRRGVETRNGREEVVAGMVIKLYGTNATTVIGRVEKKLDEIQRTLPKGVEIVPYYEQKTLIQASVKTVNDALVQGIFLVILVLVLFIGGVRPSLVAAFSIPFSVLFATLWMKILGMTANLMTLGGLAIGIGMMVDGTIVVVENVERVLREHGRGGPLSRLHLVARASGEVIRPILFAISIVILVFLPLFALQGVEGKTFRPLAYTIALAMLGSLIYALVFAPVFADLLMRAPKPLDQNARGTGRFGRIRWNVKRFFTGWSAGLVGLFTFLYRPLVSWVVVHRLVTLVGALLLFILGGLAFFQLGSEFTPKLQEGTIIVRLTMAPSISLQESTRVTQLVERRIMKVPEVKEVLSRIGRGEVGAHTDPVNSAEIYVVLKPKRQWRGDWTQKDVERLVRRAIGEVPGVLTNFTQPIAMTLDEMMEGIRAELAVKLYGQDLDELRKKAEEIAAVIRKVRGAADVQVEQVTGQPQLLIRLDRKAVARWGLNLADVQRVVSAAVGGADAGQIFEGVRRFEILVRYPRRFRDNKRAIESILITTPMGQQVPLSQLAEVRPVVGPRQITRENTQRFISIQCNVRGRDIGSFVAEAKRAIDGTVELPPGYFVTWGGQYKLQREANRRLALVVPITLAGIFLMLFLTFNSIRYALLILLNIPLALVGGVVALWITGRNLSVPSSVGFIALFGIALENGLVLVTVMNELSQEGLKYAKAAVHGATLRLRPVLMTALTTGLGLVPLLLSHGTGSEVQRPLATVVVGGLITATAATLFVLPALYGWFSPKKDGG